jgi:gliding motility-associated-like protein
MTVTVQTSEIFVPNVFTPNGDDVNDEFCVAYKSITSFQCWVYNRWGREVYMWTDPTKGWNGKINGKDATPGAYFYVIKARGSDFDPNATPNPVTHLRIGEYLLKGDINLLRGVK